MPDPRDDEEDDDESYDLEVRGGLTVDEYALELLLCGVSQSCYFASWMADTEYEVWRLLTEGGDWGRSDASAEQTDLDEIRELANRIGSWIVTDREAGADAPPKVTWRAVPFAEWRAMYTEWRAEGGPGGPADSGHAAMTEVAASGFLGDRR
jgi:hypothetical protein